MENYIKWFEDVCGELARDPVVATRALQEFACSPEAFDVSKHLIDVSQSELIQYQALYVLHNCYINHWRDLSKDQRVGVRHYLWYHITSGERSFEYSVFKKMIYVHAMVLQRNWLEESAHERADLFRQMSTFITNSQGRPEQSHNVVIAARVLSAVVEVFSHSYSNHDGAGSSPGHQQAVHVSFQRDKTFSGLAGVYSIAFQLLTLAVAAVKSEAFFPSPSGRQKMVLSVDVVEAAGEVCRLLVELLGWDFTGEKEGDARSSDIFESSSVTIPDEWVQEVGGGEVFFSVLQEAIECYHVVRDALVILESHPSNTRKDGCRLSFEEIDGVGMEHKRQHPIAVARDYLSSLRQLILSVASISTGCSAIFPSGERSGALVDFILRETIPLLSGSMMYLTRQTTASHIPDGVTADSLAEICAQECEHLLFILIRLMGNFHLVIVGRVSSFEAFVVALGKVTYDLASNMGTITESATAAARGGRDQLSHFESVLEGWQGDLLAQLLDLWAMVLDDPLMQETCSDDQTSQSIATHLREGLYDMAGQIFCRLFDCILLIALQDALVAEEEDLDDDIEDIETRNMDELLRGISLIGRSLALWESIGHVRLCLQNSLDEYENILNQTCTSISPNSKWQSRESSKVLEVQRVCTMFLTHLCFEGAGLTSTGGAITSSDIGALAASNSSNSGHSEIPVLPKYLTSVLGAALLSARSDRTSHLREVLATMHSHMAGTVAACARSLELQRQALHAGTAARSNLALLEKLEGLQSPVVMQGWFEFFKEYIRTYVGADESLYHVPDIAIYTRQACGAAATGYPVVEVSDDCLRTNTCPALLSGLVTCVLECVCLMGSQMQMCISALSILRVMASNLIATEIVAVSCDPVIVHLWDVLSGASEVDSSSAYYELTSRLSPICVTHLWEGASSLARRIGMAVASREDSGGGLDHPAMNIFPQMCTFLHKLCTLADGGDRGQGNAEQLVVCISAVRGVARSRIPSSTVDEVDASLFQGDDTYEVRMQKLRGAMSQTVSHLLNLTLPTFLQLVTVELKVDDDVRLTLLLELFVLLEDYVEYQFSFLSSQSATVVYESALRLFWEFSSRVQYKEELSATEAGVMVGYIRLLDVLSSQEFVFPSDDGLGPSTISPSLPGDVDVSGVVSMGLLVLTRVISPELLQHYPAVQGSYFNVLSYALSSSEHILPVGGRNKRSGGSETLRDFLGITEDVMADIVGKILNLLLWGVTSSLNTSTARMALQGIQNCAVAQLTSGGSGTGQAGIILKEFLHHCQDHFVTMLMQGGRQSLLVDPSSDGGSMGLSWDRIDSFATALLAVVASDTNSQSSDVQEILVTLFQQLVTDRNVDMSDYRKVNARLFVANLRHFFTESRILLPSLS